MWLTNRFVFLKPYLYLAAGLWFLLIIIVITKTKAKEMIASPMFKINDKVNNCKDISCKIRTTSVLCRIGVATTISASLFLFYIIYSFLQIVNSS